MRKNDLIFFAWRKAEVEEGNMKLKWAKIIILIIACALLVGALAACSGRNSTYIQSNNSPTETDQAALEKDVQTIELDPDFKTEYYIGEELDTSGNIIVHAANEEKGVYSYTVPVSSRYVSKMGFSTDTVGNRTASLTYGGATVSFYYTVYVKSEEGAYPGAPSDALSQASNDVVKAFENFNMGTNDDFLGLALEMEYEHIAYDEDKNITKHSNFTISLYANFDMLDNSKSSLLLEIIDQTTLNPLDVSTSATLIIGVYYNKGKLYLNIGNETKVYNDEINLTAIGREIKNLLSGDLDLGVYIGGFLSGQLQTGNSTVDGIMGIVFPVLFTNAGYSTYEQANVKHKTITYDMNVDGILGLRGLVGNFLPGGVAWSSFGLPDTLDDVMEYFLGFDLDFIMNHQFPHTEGKLNVYTSGYTNGYSDGGMFDGLGFEFTSDEYYVKIDIPKLQFTSAPQTIAFSRYSGYGYAGLTNLSANIELEVKTDTGSFTLNDVFGDLLKETLGTVGDIPFNIGSQRNYLLGVEIKTDLDLLNNANNKVEINISFKNGTQDYLMKDGEFVLDKSGNKILVDHELMLARILYDKEVLYIDMSGVGIPILSYSGLNITATLQGLLGSAINYLNPNAVLDPWVPNQTTTPDTGETVPDTGGTQDPTESASTLDIGAMIKSVLAYIIMPDKSEDERIMQIYMTNANINTVLKAGKLLERWESVGLRSLGLSLDITSLSDLFNSGITLDVGLSSCLGVTARVKNIKLGPIPEFNMLDTEDEDVKQTISEIETLDYVDLHLGGFVKFGSTTGEFNLDALAGSLIQNLLLTVVVDADKEATADIVESFLGMELYYDIYANVNLRKLDDIELMVVFSLPNGDKVVSLNYIGSRVMGVGADANSYMDSMVVDLSNLYKIEEQLTVFKGVLPQNLPKLKVENLGLISMLSGVNIFESLFNQTDLNTPVLNGSFDINTRPLAAGEDPAATEEDALDIMALIGGLVDSITLKNDSLQILAAADAIAYLVGMMNIVIDLDQNGEDDNIAFPYTNITITINTSDDDTLNGEGKGLFIHAGIKAYDPEQTAELISLDLALTDIKFGLGKKNYILASELTQYSVFQAIADSFELAFSLEGKLHMNANDDNYDIGAIIAGLIPSLGQVLGLNLDTKDFNIEGSFKLKANLKFAESGASFPIDLVNSELVLLVYDDDTPDAEGDPTVMAKVFYVGGDLYLDLENYFGIPRICVKNAYQSIMDFIDTFQSSSASGAESVPDASAEEVSTPQNVLMALTTQLAIRLLITPEALNLTLTKQNIEAIFNLLNLSFDLPVSIEYLTVEFGLDPISISLSTQVDIFNLDLYLGGLKLQLNYFDFVYDEDKISTAPEETRKETEQFMVNPNDYEITVDNGIEGIYISLEGSFFVRASEDFVLDLTSTVNGALGGIDLSSLAGTLGIEEELQVSLNTYMEFLGIVNENLTYTISAFINLNNFEKSEFEIKLNLSNGEEFISCIYFFDETVKYWLNIDLNMIQDEEVFNQLSDEEKADYRYHDGAGVLYFQTNYRFGIAPFKMMTTGNFIEGIVYGFNDLSDQYVLLRDMDTSELTLAQMEERSDMLNDARAIMVTRIDNNKRTAKANAVALTQKIIDFLKIANGETVTGYTPYVSYYNEMEDLYAELKGYMTLVRLSLLSQDVLASYNSMMSMASEMLSSRDYFNAADHEIYPTINDDVSEMTDYLRYFRDTVKGSGEYSSASLYPVGKVYSPRVDIRNAIGEINNVVNIVLSDGTIAVKVVKETLIGILQSGFGLDISSYLEDIDIEVDAGIYTHPVQVKLGLALAQSGKEGSVEVGFDIKIKDINLVSKIETLTPEETALYEEMNEITIFEMKTSGRFFISLEKMEANLTPILLGLLGDSLPETFATDVIVSIVEAFNGEIYYDLTAHVDTQNLGKIDIGFVLKNKEGVEIASIYYMSTNGATGDLYIDINNISENMFEIPPIMIKNVGNFFNTTATTDSASTTDGIETPSSSVYGSNVLAATIALRFCSDYNLSPYAVELRVTLGMIYTLLELMGVDTSLYQAEFGSPELAITGGKDDGLAIDFAVPGVFKAGLNFNSLEADLFNIDELILMDEEFLSRYQDLGTALDELELKVSAGGFIGFYGDKASWELTDILDVLFDNTEEEKALGIVFEILEQVGGEIRYELQASLSLGAIFNADTDIFSSLNLALCLYSGDTMILGVYLKEGTLYAQLSKLSEAFPNLTLPDVKIANFFSMLSSDETTSETDTTAESAPLAQSIRDYVDLINSISDGEADPETVSDYTDTEMDKFASAVQLMISGTDGIMVFVSKMAIISLMGSLGFQTIGGNDGSDGNPVSEGIDLVPIVEVLNPNLQLGLLYDNAIIDLKVGLGPMELEFAFSNIGVDFKNTDLVVPQFKESDYSAVDDTLNAIYVEASVVFDFDATENAKLELSEVLAQFLQINGLDLDVAIQFLETFAEEFRLDVCAYINWTDLTKLDASITLINNKTEEVILDIVFVSGSAYIDLFCLGIEPVKINDALSLITSLFSTETNPAPLETVTETPDVGDTSPQALADRALQETEILQNTIYAMLSTKGFAIHITDSALYALLNLLGLDATLSDAFSDKDEEGNVIPETRKEIVIGDFVGSIATPDIYVSIGENNRLVDLQLSFIDNTDMSRSVDIGLGISDRILVDLNNRITAPVKTKQVLDEGGELQTVPYYTEVNEFKVLSFAAHAKIELDFGARRYTNLNKEPLSSILAGVLENIILYIPLDITEDIKIVIDIDLVANIDITDLSAMELSVIAKLNGNYLLSLIIENNTAYLDLSALNGPKILMKDAIRAFIPDVPAEVDTGTDTTTETETTQETTETADETEEIITDPVAIDVSLIIKTGGLFITLNTEIIKNVLKFIGINQFEIFNEMAINANLGIKDSSLFVDLQVDLDSIGLGVSLDSLKVGFGKKEITWRYSAEYTDVEQIDTISLNLGIEIDFMLNAQRAGMELSDYVDFVFSMLDINIEEMPLGLRGIIEDIISDKIYINVFADIDLNVIMDALGSSEINILDVLNKIEASIEISSLKNPDFFIGLYLSDGGLYFDVDSIGVSNIKISDFDDIIYNGLFAGAKDSNATSDTPETETVEEEEETTDVSTDEPIEPMSAILALSLGGQGFTATVTTSMIYALLNFLMGDMSFDLPSLIEPLGNPYVELTVSDKIDIGLAVVMGNSIPGGEDVARLGVTLIGEKFGVNVSSYTYYFDPETSEWKEYRPSVKPEDSDTYLEYSDMSFGIDMEMHFEFSMDPYTEEAVDEYGVPYTKFLSGDVPVSALLNAILGLGFDTKFTFEENTIFHLGVDIALQFDSAKLYDMPGVKIQKTIVTTGTPNYNENGEEYIGVKGDLVYDSLGNPVYLTEPIHKTAEAGDWIYDKNGNYYQAEAGDKVYDANKNPVMVEQYVFEQKQAFKGDGYYDVDGNYHSSALGGELMYYPDGTPLYRRYDGIEGKVIIAYSHNSDPSFEEDDNPDNDYKDSLIEVYFTYDPILCSDVVYISADIMGIKANLKYTELDGVGMLYKMVFGAEILPTVEDELASEADNQAQSVPQASSSSYSVSEVSSAPEIIHIDRQYIVTRLTSEKFAIELSAGVTYTILKYFGIDFEFGDGDLTIDFSPFTISANVGRPPRQVVDSETQEITYEAGFNVLLQVGPFELNFDQAYKTREKSLFNGDPSKFTSISNLDRVAARIEGQLGAREIKKFFDWSETLNGALGVDESLIGINLEEDGEVTVNFAVSVEARLSNIKNLDLIARFSIYDDDMKEVFTMIIVGCDASGTFNPAIYFQTENKKLKLGMEEVKTFLGIDLKTLLESLLNSGASNTDDTINTEIIVDTGERETNIVDVVVKLFDSIIVREDAIGIGISTNFFAVLWDDIMGMGEIENFEPIGDMRLELDTTEGFEKITLAIDFDIERTLHAWLSLGNVDTDFMGCLYKDYVDNYFGVEGSDPEGYKQFTALPLSLLKVSDETVYDYNNNEKQVYVLDDSQFDSISDYCLQIDSKSVIYITGRAGDKLDLTSLIGRLLDGFGLAVQAGEDLGKYILDPVTKSYVLATNEDGSYKDVMTFEIYTSLYIDFGNLSELKLKLDIDLDKRDIFSLYYVGDGQANSNSALYIDLTGLALPTIKLANIDLGGAVKGMLSGLFTDDSEEETSDVSNVPWEIATKKELLERLGDNTALLLINIAGYGSYKNEEDETVYEKGLRELSVTLNGAMLSALLASLANVDLDISLGEIALGYYNDEDYAGIKICLNKSGSFAFDFRIVSVEGEVNKITDGVDAYEDRITGYVYEHLGALYSIPHLYSLASGVTYNSDTGNYFYTPDGSLISYLLSKNNRGYYDYTIEGESFMLYDLFTLRSGVTRESDGTLKYMDQILTLTDNGYEYGSSVLSRIYDLYTDDSGSVTETAPESGEYNFVTTSSDVCALIYDDYYNDITLFSGIALSVEGEIRLITVNDEPVKSDVIKALEDMVKSLLGIDIFNINLEEAYHVIGFTLQLGFDVANFDNTNVNLVLTYGGDLLLAVHLVGKNNAIYADLSGLGLMKVKIQGIDVKGLLGGLLSSVVDEDKGGIDLGGLIGGLLGSIGGEETSEEMQQRFSDIFKAQEAEDVSEPQNADSAYTSAAMIKLMMGREDFAITIDPLVLIRVVEMLNLGIELPSFYDIRLTMDLLAGITNMFGNFKLDSVGNKLQFYVPERGVVLSFNPGDVKSPTDTQLARFGGLSFDSMVTNLLDGIDPDNLIALLDQNKTTYTFFDLEGYISYKAGIEQAAVAAYNAAHADEEDFEPIKARVYSSANLSMYSDPFTGTTYGRLVIDKRKTNYINILMQSLEGHDGTEKKHAKMSVTKNVLVVSLGTAISILGFNLPLDFGISTIDILAMLSNKNGTIVNDEEEEEEIPDIYRVYYSKSGTYYYETTTGQNVMLTTGNYYYVNPRIYVHVGEGEEAAYIAKGYVEDNAGRLVTDEETGETELMHYYKYKYNIPGVDEAFFIDEVWFDAEPGGISNIIKEINVTVGSNKKTVESENKNKVILDVMLDSKFAFDLIATINLMLLKIFSQFCPEKEGTGMGCYTDTLGGIASYAELIGLDISFLGDWFGSAADLSDYYLDKETSVTINGQGLDGEDVYYDTVPLLTYNYATRNEFETDVRIWSPCLPVSIIFFLFEGGQGDPIVPSWVLGVLRGLSATIEILKHIPATKTVGDVLGYVIKGIVTVAKVAIKSGMEFFATVLPLAYNDSNLYGSANAQIVVDTSQDAYPNRLANINLNLKGVGSEFLDLQLINNGIGMRAVKDVSSTFYASKLTILSDDSKTRAAYTIVSLPEAVVFHDIYNTSYVTIVYQSQEQADIAEGVYGTPTSKGNYTLLSQSVKDKLLEAGITSGYFQTYENRVTVTYDDKGLTETGQIQLLTSLKDYLPWRVEVSFMDGGNSLESDGVGISWDIKGVNLSPEGGIGTLKGYVLNQTISTIKAIVMPKPLEQLYPIADKLYHSTVANTLYSSDSVYDWIMANIPTQSASGIELTTYHIDPFDFDEEAFKEKLPTEYEFDFTPNDLTDQISSVYNFNFEWDLSSIDITKNKTYLTLKYWTDDTVKYTREVEINVINRNIIGIKSGFVIGSNMTVYGNSITYDPYDETDDLLEALSNIKSLPLSTDGGDVTHEVKLDLSSVEDYFNSGDPYMGGNLSVPISVTSGNGVTQTFKLNVNVLSRRFTNVKTVLLASGQTVAEDRTESLYNGDYAINEGTTITFTPYINEIYFPSTMVFDFVGIGEEEVAVEWQANTQYDSDSINENFDFHHGATYEFSVKLAAKKYGAQSFAMTVIIPEKTVKSVSEIKFSSSDFDTHEKIVDYINTTYITMPVTFSDGTSYNIPAKWDFSGVTFTPGRAGGTYYVSVELGNEMFGTQTVKNVAINLTASQYDTVELNYIPVLDPFVSYPVDSEGYLTEEALAMITASTTAANGEEVLPVSSQITLSNGTKTKNIYTIKWKLPAGGLANSGSTTIYAVVGGTEIPVTASLKDRTLSGVTPSTITIDTNTFKFDLTSVQVNGVSLEGSLDLDNFKPSYITDESYSEVSLVNSLFYDALSANVYEQSGFSARLRIGLYDQYVQEFTVQVQIGQTLYENDVQNIVYGNMVAGAFVATPYINLTPEEKSDLISQGVLATKGLEFMPYDAAELKLPTYAQVVFKVPNSDDIETVTIPVSFPGKENYDYTYSGALLAVDAKLGTDLSGFVDDKVVLRILPEYIRNTTLKLSYSLNPYEDLLTNLGLSYDESLNRYKGTTTAYTLYSPTATYTATELTAHSVDVIWPDLNSLFNNENLYKGVSETVVLLVGNAHAGYQQVSVEVKVLPKIAKSLSETFEGNIYDKITFNTGITEVIFTDGTRAALELTEWNLEKLEWTFAGGIYNVNATVGNNFGGFQTVKVAVTVSQRILSKITLADTTPSYYDGVETLSDGTQRVVINPFDGFTNLPETVKVTYRNGVVEENVAVSWSYKHILNAMSISGGLYSQYTNMALIALVHDGSGNAAQVYEIPVRILDKSIVRSEGDIWVSKTIGGNYISLPDAMSFDPYETVYNQDFESADFSYYKYARVTMGTGVTTEIRIFELSWTFIERATGLSVDLKNLYTGRDIIARLTFGTDVGPATTLTYDIDVTVENRVYSSGIGNIYDAEEMQSIGQPLASGTLSTEGFIIDVYSTNTTYEDEGKTITEYPSTLNCVNNGSYDIDFMDGKTKSMPVRFNYTQVNRNYKGEQGKIIAIIGSENLGGEQIISLPIYYLKREINELFDAETDLGLAESVIAVNPTNTNNMQLIANAATYEENVDGKFIIPTYNYVNSGGYWIKQILDNEVVEYENIQGLFTFDPFNTYNAGEIYPSTSSVVFNTEIGEYEKTIPIYWDYNSVKMQLKGGLFKLSASIGSGEDKQTLYYYARVLDRRIASTDINSGTDEALRPYDFNDCIDVATAVAQKVFAGSDFRVFFNSGDMISYMAGTTIEGVNIQFVMDTDITMTYKGGSVLFTTDIPGYALGDAGVQKSKCYFAVREQYIKRVSLVPQFAGIVGTKLINDGLSEEKMMLSDYNPYALSSEELSDGFESSSTEREVIEYLTDETGEYILEEGLPVPVKWIDRTTYVDSRRGITLVTEIDNQDYVMTYSIYVDDPYYHILNQYGGINLPDQLAICVGEKGNQNDETWYKIDIIWSNANENIVNLKYNTETLKAYFNMTLDNQRFQIVIHSTPKIIKGSVASGNGYYSDVLGRMVYPYSETGAYIDDSGNTIYAADDFIAVRSMGYALLFTDGTYMVIGGSGTLTQNGNSYDFIGSFDGNTVQFNSLVGETGVEISYTPENPEIYTKHIKKYDRFFIGGGSTYSRINKWDFSIVPFEGTTANPGIAYAEMTLASRGGETVFWKLRTAEREWINTSVQSVYAVKENQNFVIDGSSTLQNTLRMFYNDGTYSTAQIFWGELMGYERYLGYGDDAKSTAITMNAGVINAGANPTTTGRVYDETDGDLAVVTWTMEEDRVNPALDEDYYGDVILCCMPNTDNNDGDESNAYYVHPDDPGQDVKQGTLGIGAYTDPFTYVTYKPGVPTASVIYPSDFITSHPIDEESGSSGAFTNEYGVVVSSGNEMKSLTISWKAGTKFNVAYLPMYRVYYKELKFALITIDQLNTSVILPWATATVAINGTVLSGGVNAINPSKAKVGTTYTLTLPTYFNEGAGNAHSINITIIE